MKVGTLIRTMKAEVKSRKSHEEENIFMEEESDNFSALVHGR